MEKIGRYEVERELGFGGMGEVYLARDPYINRQVAIKVLPRPREQEAKQFRARFEREARIIATLEHPGIVPIHDFGYHDDQPYIVMRYMAGGTLKERIKDEPLSTTETIRIFRQLTPALDYIHRQGIVHRDLKPTNILFDLVGNAYVSDFGIAKISETSADLTGGATIGTPAYMSPEQARGTEELDRRSDVYSMGVVLFEMLTGKVPYKADTPISQAMAHIIEPIPDLTKLRPNLSRSYQTLLYKALVKERGERFGAMSDLLLALEKAEQDRQIDLPVIRESRKEDLTVPVGLAPKLQTPQGQKIPRWAWMSCGAGAIIFVVLLGILVSNKFLLPALTPPTLSPETSQVQTVTPTKTKSTEAQNRQSADAPATTDPQATADMLAATVAAEATSSAESVHATATVFMQQTETQATTQARNTETAATRTAATEQAIMAATAQAQPMVDLIADLQSEGLLSLTDGEYIQMADFDESYAQLNTFQWYPTFLSPSNFMLRVDIAYESASDTADWWNAGCGFVFRQEDNDNFYVAFLNMDGNVNVYRWRNGNGSNLSRGYYGKLELPKGGAEMVLVVENNWITVLINGVKTVRITDSSFSEGKLTFAIVSGTNKDFGTRCQMTNVDLWEFK